MHQLAVCEEATVLFAPRLFILTGGPGAGKTTLLAELERAGHGIKAETGRAVIQAQMASGGTALPWRDRLAFSEAMLAAELDWHERYCQPGASDAWTFCDRGLPDILAYLRLEGMEVLAEAGDLLTRTQYWAKRWRYAQPVLLLPPWKEIYCNDKERKQDWETAVATYEVVRQVYAGLGYRLLEVPPGPPAQRGEFVLAWCGE